MGFVGTTTANQSKVYSDAAAVTEQELELPETYEKLMSLWLKAFITNERLPDVTVLYREGLNLKDLETRGKAELEGLQRVVRRARDNKYLGFCPHIVYILVHKQVSKRLYRTQ